jgi:ATP-dependent exoDNAse (exonuclease V) alpha subunit
MQIENDYGKEIYYGDMGYIDDVDPNAGKMVANSDGQFVTHGFGELDMLVHAYAATIRKSHQGSEYPAVVIPVFAQHYAMLQWNLLYPGVRRGKKLVVLVGQKKASPSGAQRLRPAAVVESGKVAGGAALTRALNLRPLLRSFHGSANCSVFF